jgi:hypothetical protein
MSNPNEPKDLFSFQNPDLLIFHDLLGTTPELV